MSPVSPVPPDALVRIQRIARETAERACREAQTGMSELELAVLVESWLDEAGCEGVWSATNIGFGEGSLSCQPDRPPTARKLRERDIGYVDVHPISPDGWWGDCARTFVVGDDPELLQALDDVERVCEETLRYCRPGMPADELFGHCLVAIENARYRLLDERHHVGHSLRRASAYDDGYVEAANASPMWGAWAIEPFFGTTRYGLRLEDVVWFGPDGVVALR